MDINYFINFKNKWRCIFGNVVLLSLSSGLLLCIYQIFNNKFPYIISSVPIAIKIAAFFLYLALIFASIKLLGKMIKKLFRSNKTYLFKTHDWPKKWIFVGNSYSQHNSELVVQSSRAGLLLKDYFWKNFKMTFDVQFEKERKTLGIVFKAENLDNYFMLQISKSHKCIKPHIRYNSGWEIIMPEMTNVFEAGDNFKICLEVKDEIAYLKVNGNLEFTWILPTHVDVNHLEIQPKNENSQEPQIEENTSRYVKEIPFRLGSGMIGFRVSPGENAIVKALKIQKI